MAPVVLDANAVGQVVTYVAPGFLAFLGYRARYPSVNRPAGELLIISVVASLPLVALVAAMLPGGQDATELGYVSLLLLLGFALGYVVALLRGTARIKGALGRLGYRIQPEGTIYAQTLQRMSEDAPVTVQLKDGPRFSGCPRNGPQCKDDGINELYLVYVQVQDDAGAWQAVGGPAVIVPFSEIRYIVLSEEPTGAPADINAPEDQRPALAPAA